MILQEQCLQQRRAGSAPRYLSRLVPYSGLLVEWAHSLATVLLAGLLCGCAGHRPSAAADYREIYDKPLYSSGAQFAALPPSVQNTIRAQAGSAEIDHVVKDTSSGRMVYRIYFQNWDLLPPMYVAPDGSLLDPDLRVAIEAAPSQASVVTEGAVTGLTLSDLPPAVVKAVQRQAPDAEVDSIVKQGHGDQTSFLISFKDRMHPALHIASDGTVLVGADHR